MNLSILAPESTLRICGLYNLTTNIQDFKPDVVISLLNPDIHERPTFDGEHYIDYFHDDFNIRHNRQRVERHQVQTLLNLRHIWQQRKTVLIHCHAGKSRSAALALSWLAACSEPGQESECVEILAGLCPQAEPNRLFIRYTEEILNRGNALREALTYDKKLGWRRRKGKSHF